MAYLKLLAAISLILPGVFSASADDWKSRSIYQLVTDRFANSDSSASCNSEDRKYCGGTYKDIINHLDYIQGMGFDAIWISPIHKNVEGNTANGYAYHGYWPSDINSLNDHFGSSDDLKSLVSAVHNKNMYIMVDVVVNHLVAIPTSNSVPQSFDYSSLTFTDSSKYHSQCFIQDYNNQTEVEQCWLGDTSLPLIDVNTEDSNIASTYNTWISNLVKDYNFDGVRIDTVKHVRKDFWKDFTSSAGVFTIGEVLHGDTDYVKGYTEVMDNVLDYPSWFTLTSAFYNNSGSMSAHASQYTKSQSSFSKGLFTAGSFLENHDNARFQSHTTDTGLVANAVAWPFINDGIPILYYGQEQDYKGAEDPFNREALWFSGYGTDKTLVKLVTSLNKARKLAAKKNSKFTSTASKFIDQSDKSTLAISKAPLLTLLTNAGSSGSASWSIPSSAGLFKSGDTLVNLLTCKTMAVGSDGSLSAQSSSGQPMVIVPTSQLDGSICSDVSGGSSNGVVKSSASIAGAVLMTVLVSATMLL